MMDLKFEQLTYGYYKKYSLFNRISYCFQPGKLTLITGDNGCGKSTLLRLMAGILSPTNGHVYFNDQDVSLIVPAVRIQYIAYLPQNIRHFFTFKTGREQLVFVLENIQTDPDKIEERIDEIVKKYNLENFIDQQITTLSGGELQRIALAIILSLNPDYLLLDEPFANLDEINQQILTKLLQQQKAHSSIIIVDHQYTYYRDICDKWLNLDQGKLVEFVPHLTLRKKDTMNEISPLMTSYKFLLNWDDLNYGYSNKTLVKNSHFNLPQGKIGLLYGNNGCGKSTLFSVLTKQHLAFTGRVSFNEQDENKVKARQWMQFVTLGFQNSENQFIKTTVSEEIKSAQAATHHSAFWNDERIAEWLNRFNLKKMINESPYCISGGQQKKLQLLVLAIICSPVILLDEIFTGLDKNSLSIAWNLILLLKQQGCAILIIDHQYQNLGNYDYVLEINKCRLQPRMIKGGE